MHKNRSVDVHQFAMVPRAEIPRASFRMQRAHKATFDADILYPILCEEVLPGDSVNVKATLFARLSTPLFPIMDNLHMDTFFFFVPNRLVWSNWQKFMGQQDNPGDSISYLIPTVTSPAGGYAVNSLYDHFGLPTAGQISGGNTTTNNSLPMRMYNLIYNEWFRDENMVSSMVRNMGDGPDVSTDYQLLKRMKRHDYFTSCLPWPQKGASVSLPLGTSAPVISNGVSTFPLFKENSGGAGTSAQLQRATASAGSAVTFAGSGGPGTTTNLTWASTGLIADLSTATAATINQLRQSFQIQKLLERDARGGTRYTEIVRAHFGVISPDARLQRPEYLGGGSTPVIINPIAQTSATGVSGGTTPVATLAGIGTALGHNHGFSQSFTEHGYIIGLIHFRGDLTYQQGMRKHWSRSTRYDFYFPAFAMLGEQAVLRKEIYCIGTPANDDAVFGYQERWAEYRYSPSSVAGLFRSTSAGTLDAWHLAQRFTGPPSLAAGFINSGTPLERVLAVGAAAAGQQFIFDSFWDMHWTRPMPLYSVPGLIDHF